MNTKKNGQRNSSMFMAFLLLVAAVLACSTGNETEKANKLVDEGSAAGQEYNKYVTAADEKTDLAGKEELQPEEARATAKEAIAAYDKAKEKCKEASRKLEEASKLKIHDKFKEYLALKIKEFNKRAEVAETAKGTPQALIDSESRASYISMANANNERVNRLVKEADDLAAQAAKLQKDNPDVFKS